MSTIQDKALQISRANRGYRTAPETSDFLQPKNFVFSYNANGTINTIIISKFLLGAGTKLKTLTFGYSGAGDLETINEEISDWNVALSGPDPGH